MNENEPNTLLDAVDALSKPQRVDGANRMQREDWITIDQAMERTRRGRTTIYRWINNGDIRSYRPAKTLLLFRDDVDKAELVMVDRIGKKKPRKKAHDAP